MPISVVILAAGQGKRMKSDLPKVLQPLAGRSLLKHVVDSARAIDAADIHVVYGHGGERVRDTLAKEKLNWVLQAQQLGTGHALQQAMPGVPDDHLVLVMFGDVPLVRVDKHKVLQVLINVIRNAKYAVSESSRLDKRIVVSIAGNGNGHVKIAIADNGIGIPPENLSRIFGHGFTTRIDGHGFGLHSAALAAKELGGSLLAHSSGPNLGAIFTLELPVATSSTT